jgi:hypothetical protein
MSDFPWQVGIVSAINSSDTELDADLECIHARPIFVPHNNTVVGKPADAVSGWYNTSLPSIAWTEVGIGGRLRYMSDIWTTPWVKSTWTNEPARAVFYGYLPADAGAPGTRFNYVPTDCTIDLRSPTMTAQGLYLQLGCELDPRTEVWTSSGGLYSSSYTYPSPSAEKPYIRLKIRVDSYSGVGGTWYTFERSSDGHVVIYKSSSIGSLGTKVREIVPTVDPSAPIGSSNFGYFGFYGWSGVGDAGNNTVRVRIRAGYILVEGFGADPIKLRHLVRDTDSTTRPHAFIRQVAIQGMGVRSLQVGLAPMKFRASATYQSQDMQVGFDTTLAPLEATTHHAFEVLADRTNAVPNTTVTVTPVSSGAIINYQVAFTGTVEGQYNGEDYSANTAVIRGVTLKIPEQVSEPYGFFDEIYPEAVEVGMSFDLDNLAISSRATLTFNNFSPISKVHPNGPDLYWGEFLSKSGVAAVSIDLQISGYSPQGALIATSGWIRVFTGYFNARSTVTMDSGGQSKAIVECYGREMAACEDVFALPWFDGWNVYAAAAYLANLGGVKRGVVGDSDLKFRALVPDDPYDDSPGGGSYFLSQGSGGSPLQQYPGGARPWDVLNRMLKPIGFLRYFDAYGKFQIEPWQLESTSVPFRVFHMFDNLAEGASGSLASAVFNGAATIDMTEVRNLTTIIGVDAFGPAWDPLVAHRSSSYISTDPNPWALRGGGFKPFRAALVWVDSQFATLEYASDTADQVHQVVSRPSMTVPMRTWLQPDLFPGARVGIYDLRAGLYDRQVGAYKELMVMTVSHRVANGEIPTTQLGLRFVPPTS